jgi:hypothetical protein
MEKVPVSVSGAEKFTQEKKAAARKLVDPMVQLLLMWLVMTVSGWVANHRLYQIADFCPVGGSTVVSRQ